MSISTAKLYKLQHFTYHWQGNSCYLSRIIFNSLMKQRPATNSLRDVIYTSTLLPEIIPVLQIGQQVRLGGMPAQPLLHEGAEG